MTLPAAETGFRATPGLQFGATAAGLGLTLAGMVWVARDGLRSSALLLLGLLLGMVLQAGRFGFSGAYRRLLSHGETAGVEAQFVLLAALTLLSAGIFALIPETIGAYAPIGPQLAFGAFLFGIGMQLGDGCGSGTLFALGGGSLRMVVTLAAFCAGAFRATLDWSWWESVLPAGPVIALDEQFGMVGGTVATLAILAMLWWVARRFGRPGPPLDAPIGRTTAALLLAGLAALVLLVAGQPWSVTWAFGLWAAELTQALGWDPASSPYWSSGAAAAALAGGPSRDAISLLDAGVILGALIAAGLTRRWQPRLDRRPASLAAALIGGLMMGYGARLAYGCNIGALVAGVSSTSLHAWLWLPMALAGSWLGIRLRPRFGMSA